MARVLEVYLERYLVGRLSQNEGGQMSFQYDAEWLTYADRIAISCSLPLQQDTFPQRVCRGFFGGLLPEAGNRSVIAKILQVSDKNDFAMLERIGGECAGALTFIPQGDSLPPVDSHYRQLNDDELLKVLKTLPRRPLLAGDEGLRLSLAGAQDKLAVRVDQDGRLSLPLHYAPSTHILKPANPNWQGIVSNETYCMSLAQEVGLNVAETSAHQIGDTGYLLSKRFDRIEGSAGKIIRLHQEDFCQALGVASEFKYQAEGGSNLKACFSVLRDHSSNIVSDVRDLLRAVTFNLLVGNNDAHGKNFSIIYQSNDNCRLAPLYDIVCTQCYPELENKMAMKMGGQNKSELIGKEQLGIFAKDAGLGVAATKRSVLELAELVRESTSKVEQPDATAEMVAALVVERCEGLISRLA